jgi:hypothetical protein
VGGLWSHIEQREITHIWFNEAVLARVDGRTVKGELKGVQGRRRVGHVVGVVGGERWPRHFGDASMKIVWSDCNKRCLLEPNGRRHWTRAAGLQVQLRRVEAEATRGNGNAEASNSTPHTRKKWMM